VDSSDLSEPCLRWGVPAPPHGEPHHREGDGPVGLGSGGAKDPTHISRVVLCRACHNAVHLGEFTLTLFDGVATGFENGMVVFERGVEVRDEGDDPMFWSDEKLAATWVRLDGIAKTALELQATAAYQFYQRYRGQEKWYERAAEIIKDATGHFVHWRRIYEYTDLYLAFHEDWDKVELLGKTLALAVAQSEEPKKALEIAESARDSGRTGASAIREIRGEAEPEPKRCRHCGEIL